MSRSPNGQGQAPRLLPLMLPLLLELGLAMAMGIVGTAMAARQGDDAAAAFAMGHHVAALLFVLLRVIGAGISVVVAQHLGAQQFERAGQAGRASLAASAWLGVCLAALAALGAPAWMQLLQAPEIIAPQAAAFLMTLAPGLALESLLSAQASVLRAHLKARATLALNGAVQLTHLGLTVWLMPVMGLAGYALAMAISRALGVGLAAAAWHPLLNTAWRWKDLVQPLNDIRRRSLSDVLHVGLPAAAENILYRVCATASVAVAGSLGADCLAAQAYALQLNMLTLLPGIALGLSMEVLVGHSVGDRALGAAHRRVAHALAAGLLCSVLVASAIAFAGHSLLSLFTQDQAIVSLAVTALWWTVLLEPGRTFNIVVINGLRAVGDTRFPLMAGAVSMVVVLAGGSWLLGRHWGLGLTGVWVAYAADEWIRGLIMWHRWQSLRWVPHARQVIRLRRRMAA